MCHIPTEHEILPTVYTNPTAADFRRNRSNRLANVATASSIGFRHRGGVHVLTVPRAGFYWMVRIYINICVGCPGYSAGLENPNKTYRFFSKFNFFIVIILSTVSDLSMTNNTWHIRPFKQTARRWSMRSLKCPMTRSQTSGCTSVKTLWTSAFNSFNRSRLQNRKIAGSGRPFLVATQRDDAFHDKSPRPVGTENR